MSKWISSAYIKLLMERNRLLQGNSEYELWKQTVEKVVDAMPSIDIVRCAECKWYEPLDSTRLYDCPRGLAEVTIDDFCSYGERKDND